MNVPIYCERLPNCESELKNSESAHNTSILANQLSIETHLSNLRKSLLDIAPPYQIPIELLVSLTFTADNGRCDVVLHPRLILCPTKFC